MQTAQSSALFMQLVPFVILIAFFYFGMYRPQKKREANIKQMRDNIKVGDEIVSIGGIKGKVIVVKEDYVVIESSSLNSRIDIAKWGINSVVED